MPSRTFDQLPPAKRDRFVQAALDEFAAHPYAEASISRVVAQLGIAKGSVYQYFDDKADLFCWLVAEGGRRRAAVAADIPAAGSIWDRLRATYRAGAAQWVEDPRWARIGLRVLEPTPEPRLRALRDQVHRATVAHLSSLLVQGQRAGDVRADVVVERVVPLVRAVLGPGLLDAWLARLGTELDVWMAEPGAVTEGEREALLAAADDAVDLLRRALG